MWNDWHDNRPIFELPDALAGVPQSAGSGVDHSLGIFLILYTLVLILGRCVASGVYQIYDLLWGCNVAMLLSGVGAITNRPLLCGAACCIVAVDQLCWYVDVLSYVFAGIFPVGVAKYLGESYLYL